MTLSYAERADAYAAAIIDGSIPANRLTRLAAERHVSDRAREAANDPAFPWAFDVDAVEHICAFIESLPHIEGPLANAESLLLLDEWQVFVCASINGWRDGNGLRRFRRAYIEVPRKNGKSTLLAAIGLYFFTVDDEAGVKVFTAAASTHQARIVFDLANAMAGKAVLPDGSGRPLAPVLGLMIERHRLRLENDPAGVFQPVASQTKSKDGKNPHLAIVDELHEHENPEVWNSMASALGARAHPLLIAITTAGSNVAGICYEQHRYLTGILEGSHENNAYFGVIYGADEDDDPGDPAVWRKANPGLGSAKSETYLEDEWRNASGSPFAMGEFLRKHLNRWTSVGASAFDLDGWKAGQNPALRLEDHAGRDAWIGVDLSVKDDLTTVAVVIPDNDDRIVFATHFCTQVQIDDPQNDHLAGMARGGLLTVCPGARIDDLMVEAEILRLAGIVAVQEVVFDPWRAASLMAMIDAQGLPVVEFRQSPMNMSVPVETMQGLVADQQIITDGDPVLYWMAANALVRKNGDFLRLEKRDRAAKIDGIAAIATAMGRMLAVEESAPPSPWDDPEYSMQAA